MSKHSPADVRNFALIGGPRTGKTTFAEAVLHGTGATTRLGSVRDGTTVSDSDAEEREKQHSIALGVLHAEHGGKHINLLDAPGYPDYIGETAAALAVCETAVLCVSAAEGLTFPGRRIWQLASGSRRARAVLVTHVDHAAIVWDDFISSLGEALGGRCVAVSWPQGTGPSFQGVKAVTLQPGSTGERDMRRQALVEAVVEADEQAMARFLDEGIEPSPGELARLMTKSMLSGDVIPVLCAVGPSEQGVDTFLEFAANCLPSPLDGPFLHDQEDRPVTPTQPGGSAVVFKTISDPFVGKLCLLRVGTGEIAVGQSLVLTRTGKHEKIHGLQLMQGKDHKPVDRACVGDIVAVPKVENLETSDTLHDPAHPRVYHTLVMPKPMSARAIEPVNHADDVKLSTALRKAHSEDPTFTYERSEATGQLIAHGMSLMHIETVLRRIKERHHVDVKVNLPRVALRETITAKAEGHYRHKKQTGGRGQFGEVYLRLEPAARGAGLVFEDDTVGGSIPRQFLPAVEKGVHDAMHKGVIAGYPVVDIVVRVHDGKFHDVDSDEASFKIAGARAFRDAFIKARPVLLEPLLDIEVATPSRFMGAITSDLTGRRGHITGMDSLGDTQIVKALVPQREVLAYPAALRSMTSGEGSFTSEFRHYDVVPPNVQQEIVAGFKPHEDD